MQWHQLDNMQTNFTLLQTDNHTNTSSLRPDALPDAQPTVSNTEGNKIKVVSSKLQFLTKSKIATYYKFPQNSVL